MHYTNEFIAGVIVVIGLVLSAGTLLLYAFWDIIRQSKGGNISITASSWLAKFFVRHPIAAFCLGLAAGILAGHFMWGQSVTILNP